MGTQIRALKFTADDATARRCHLPVDSAKGFGEAIAWQGGTAYLVGKADLRKLREFDRVIVDKGKKHPSVPLSRLVRSSSRIPLIAGDYGQTGQMVRSIRALVAHWSAAAPDKRPPAFVIAVGQGVFRELWNKTSAGEAAEAGSEPAAQTFGLLAVSDLDDAGSQGPLSPELLLKLLGHRKVPVKLERSFVGVSDGARLVRQLILRAAEHNDPVLILGDSGTGKERIARAVHDWSDRKGNFVTVNCGAIPSELLESELFGHEKGAFTDAYTPKIGLWPSAEGGTLFLDEIGDLSKRHQVKILRALENKTIMPVGSNKETTVNTVVVAATNRNLASMIESGTFRNDLYWRLRSFVIQAPALRTIPEDVPMLAHFFWGRITRGAAGELPHALDAELKAQPWPGNARQLKQILRTLHGMFKGETLGVGHLRVVLRMEGPAPVKRDGAPEDSILEAHRDQCLQHLRRVVKVMQECEISLEPLLAASEPEEKTIQSAQISFQYHLSQLETLRLEPTLFYSKKAFEATELLHRKLAKFVRQVLVEEKAPLDPGRKELNAEIERARAVLLDEFHRLVAAG